MSKQVALVTGGSVRIGAAIVEHFAKKGYDVAIHYKNSKEAATELSNRLKAEYGSRSLTFYADLEKEESYKNLISNVWNAYERLDCLVCNASVFEYDSIETCTRTSWDKHMETNLRAPFLLSQDFYKLVQQYNTLPNVKESSNHQAFNIIYILDQKVWNLNHHFMSYSLSKASLWALTQMLAIGMAPLMRVNAIGPGPTLKSSFQKEEEFKKQFEKILMKREVPVHEIAEAVHFICRLSSMTGQMIALDGGQHLL